MRPPEALPGAGHDDDPVGAVRPPRRQRQCHVGDPTKRLLGSGTVTACARLHRPPRRRPRRRRHRRHRRRDRPPARRRGQRARAHLPPRRGQGRGARRTPQPDRRPRLAARPHRRRRVPRGPSRRGRGLRRAAHRRVRRRPARPDGPPQPGRRRRSSATRSPHDAVGFFDARCAAALPHLRDSRGSLVAVTTAATRRVAGRATGCRPARRAAVEALVRGHRRRGGPVRRAGQLRRPGHAHRRHGRAADRHRRPRRRAPSRAPAATSRCAASARADDVAAAVVLPRQRPGAGYITGQKLDVDGGYTV